MKKSKLLGTDGSEFTVFYLSDKAEELVISDNLNEQDVNENSAGVPFHLAPDPAWQFPDAPNTKVSKNLGEKLTKAFESLLGGSNETKPLCAPSIAFDFFPKTGFYKPQEGCCVDHVPDIDLKSGRIYKVRSTDIVVRLMDSNSYYGHLYKITVHGVDFLIEKRNLMLASEEEVAYYLDNDNSIE